MNKDKLSSFGIIVATSFLSALTMGTSEVTNTIAQDNTNQTNGGVPQFQPGQFRANLSGQSVVPKLQDAKATREVEFNVNPQRNTIDYNVTVSGTDQVLSGYMQLGSPGENGPLIVYLYRAGSPPGPVDGLLAKETITANELDGPMK